MDVPFFNYVSMPPYIIVDLKNVLVAKRDVCCYGFEKGYLADSSFSNPQPYAPTKPLSCMLQLKPNYRINTKVPAIINTAPIAIFIVSASCKNIIDKIMVNATLNLSTGATCDTLPICKALK